MNKDDLLNIDNKKNIKKPLVYGAVAFLVFIIAILGIAIYNNTSSKQDNVVLPPQIKEETKQDTMFKEVPIENDTNPQNEEKKNSNESLADKLIKEETNESKQNIKQSTSINITKPKEEKKNIKKPITKTKVKVKSKTKKIKTTIKKYYVQVAALMKYKKPNEKFLELIKKEGYNYRLYETYYVKNGKKIEVVKILIGPFSKNEVKKELKKIKADITQNAFIYKVK
jgi:DedD protein